ncbi:MAG: flap endonuclease-1 [Candidatus Micrarchaeota archaeon]
MGTQLGEIVEKKKIELEAMADRVIAIDAFNTLYQFLSIIRQYDGTPLMDSQGRTTSHLSGLFYRTGKMIEAGVKPIYVFDGKPPAMKAGTLEGRGKIRTEAKEKWDKAKEEGDFESAKKYAQQSVKLNDEMIGSAKELLGAMGVPVVQAPEEGEAQASFIVTQGGAWAAASQDFDSLLFGATNLLRNMTVTGRRKLPNKNVYVLVEPELISLEENLEALKITREQLIDIGIIVGTDYNSGVYGIGPKKALQAVQAGKTAADVYKEQEQEPEVEIDSLRAMFLKPNVTKDYDIKFRPPDEKKMIEVLVEKHDFSKSRVEATIHTLMEYTKQKGKQGRLDQWFS